MRGLIIVYHRRDDLSIIGCVLRRLGEIVIADEGQPGIIARQLQGCPVGPVALVVPDGQALVDRDHRDLHDSRGPESRRPAPEGRE